MDASKLAQYEFAGELSLTGSLRPVRGALATALAVYARANPVHLVLPPESAEEAALVPQASVYRARHLLDVVRHFAPAGSAPLTTTDPQSADATNSGADADDGWARVTASLPPPRPPGPDLSDVKGQAAARRALEIAAAGGHSVLMVGPPGSGKSMLAQRFAGLLPPMSTQEALESAAIGSLSGRFQRAQWGQRPTCSPHHSASAVALVGGGSPPRPGEISLAHHGVLFLDELPEFARTALEALREPLESGVITIARSTRRAEFPARFQLIAAMNPCPCGHMGAKGVRSCHCTPQSVQRYQARLSGPLMDRIDLHVEVPAIQSAELFNARAGESTQVVQSRCNHARNVAIARQGCANHALSAPAIDTHVSMTPEATRFLHSAAARLGWSGRGLHRTLKIARTIADLAASNTVELAHVAEALQYRSTLGHSTPA